MALRGTESVGKPWHTLDDAAMRCSMTEHIASLLVERRSNATLDKQKKLPHIAKRLESEVYQQAESVAEYSDPQTLKNRLQLIALSIDSKQKAKRSMISRYEQPDPHGPDPNMIP
jgi:hypothetical protein